MNGSEAILEMLASAGVKYVFGNPGTTELPLSDALVGDERFQYILALQEVPVMAIADGFAMASHSIGFVNLHISCGLGNAMGMLYDAYREGTPLLVTAGQQDRRLSFEEPILWSDMVSVARPWTKWSAEVQRAEDLPVAMRRAMQTALMPPTGPVFLSIPVDIQMEQADYDLSPFIPLNHRVRPPVEELQRAAEVLAAAKNPVVLIGSRVVEHEAVEPLVKLAETLGAPVISESGTTHGRLSFPANHPLYAPGLPLWSPEVRSRLAEYDVLLAVGMDLLRQYVYHEPARAMPEHLRLIHLDPDPWQLNKNYPLEVALVGDYLPGLSELVDLLGSQMTAEQKQAAKNRGEATQQEHCKLREKLDARIEPERSVRPLTPLTLMHALSQAMPPHCAVIEEAVTTTGTYLERLGVLEDPTGYFGHRGWALGWGLGCSIGVKLAWPDRPVLAVLGEGAAMYGIQGLWTAAHYRIPVTFVICNNAQYQILKIGAKNAGLPAANADQFLGMDLVDPEIDFVGLARSLGVEAVRVTDPDELTERVRASLTGDKPMLFDVPIQRGTPGRLNY